MKTGKDAGESASKSREVLSLADVLAKIQHGVPADEAAVMFADLVQDVAFHRKKGTLTLKFTVAPYKGSAKQVEVSVKAVSSPPEGDPVAAIFFPDQDGNLHRDDPNQMPLDISPVARADAYLRP